MRCTGAAFRARATSFSPVRPRRVCRRPKSGRPPDPSTTISPSSTAASTSRESARSASSGKAGVRSTPLRLVMVARPSATTAIAR
ncbi:hypothetical protein BC477_11010 [Clavibacter michiganensis subsp. michiganensis]|uniref:Uncharacterized protein n=1 Tax=Clavibacter michiganensis subsp. michiganensis TaxID=33013 RepID=A0A251XHG6_CLAMM|nr:hypothetical protein BC477_11010 [Clavibacter michiganensis subsp. michiganensis]OUE02323.1 hypothetical protein CMMCAS07_09925 [Clavibacter michiganensis subsp. michiganensis]